MVLPFRDDGEAPPFAVNSLLSRSSQKADVNLHALCMMTFWKRKLSSFYFVTGRSCLNKPPFTHALYGNPWKLIRYFGKNQDQDNVS